MTDFLKEQMDYIFFCYGLAFIILAGVCVSLQKAEREKFPWHLLGLFGLTHGINEWLDMIALSLGDSGLFQSIRVTAITPFSRVAPITSRACSSTARAGRSYCSAGSKRSPTTGSSPSWPPSLSAFS